MPGLLTGSALSAGWRSFVAVMALLFGIANPLPSAAQDVGVERYRYYLTATPSRSLEDLCVGDRVLIDVAAERFLGNKRATDTDHLTNPPVQVFGVSLQGIAGNPDIGSLFPAGQKTSARGSPPGSARFSFSAKAPGSTNLVFSGTESRSWFAGGDAKFLSIELVATVKICEYDVTVQARWIDGLAVTWTAVTEVVRLRNSGQAGHYAGSATVHSLYSWSAAGCPPHALWYTSEVDIIAELEGTDELIVDADFGPVTGEDFSWLCPDDTINATEQTNKTPAPLTFTVSVSGGARHLPQTLVDNNFAILNLSGSADVSVVPARSD